MGHEDTGGLTVGQRIGHIEKDIEKMKTKLEALQVEAAKGQVKLALLMTALFTVVSLVLNKLLG